MNRNLIPTTAMVLCAGLGKRMRPFSGDLPKPLVRVAGKTLLERTLDKLAEWGVRRIIVNVSYKQELIKEHLKDRSDIIFSHEDEPLETGGGIKKALPLIGDEPFFVLNSDVIWQDGAEPLLSRLSRLWNPEDMDSLLLLVPTKKANGYSGNGDFITDSGDDPAKIKFIGDSGSNAYVFGGVQLMQPRLVSDWPWEAFPLSTVFKANAGDDGWLKRIRGIRHTGDWFHVGDGDAVKLAEAAYSH